MVENTEKKVSFEESLEELENIVRGLEFGEDDLDTSIKSYERGMKLVKQCEDKLKQAKLKVEKIKNKDENNPKLEEYEQ